MRTGRVELPRDCSHTGLSRACLPVPSTSASCREWGGQGSNLGLRGFNPALGPCSATAPSRGQGGTRTRVSEVAARQMRRSPTWPRRFRERDSNPTHLWGQSPASYRLDDPGASKNRCLHALAHSSSSLSAVGAGRAGCLSRSVSDCRPGSFQPGPRTPCGTVRVLPSSARVHPDSPSRTRTSDLSHLGGLAEQRRRPSGRPHRSTGCHATVVRSRTVRTATRCSATTTA